jgi:Crinkler effector protein N-terminal domain
MADVAHRTLTCLIEGESLPFDVEPSGSTAIFKLKELIKNMDGVLKTIDAKNLRLWKVKMTMASNGTTDFPAG